MLRQDQLTPHLRKRKRIFKRVLDILLLGFCTYGLYFIFDTAAYHLFKSTLFRETLPAIIFSVLIVGLLFKPVDYIVFGFLKKFFFRRTDQHVFVLAKLSRDIMSVLDLEELSNMVVQTLGEILHVKTASLLVYNQNEGVYGIVSAFGIPEAQYQNISLAVDRPIIDTLRNYGVPIVREKIRKLFPWQGANQLVTEFEMLQAFCVIPMIHNDQLIGSLNLGRRSSVKTFSEADIKFLGEFAKDIAPVVRNAIMVEELKRANQDLAQVQTELIQSTRLSAIEQLATGLAHEIHNPLTIISGKAQVLLLKKDKKGYDDKVEEVLKTIVKQTKRAADITRKLLMFSGGKSASSEPISFETLINDTVALVSYQTELDDIRVIKQIDHNLPVYYGNVSAFREIFLNLLLNAVQAVGKSGTIQTGVSYKTPERMIEIRVADTGVGIPEENLRQLFNPFFTTRKDATGLGLFVTQQIVHRYDGSIRIESKPGNGTVVIVQLPAGEKKETARPEDELVKPEAPFVI